MSTSKGSCQFGGILHPYHEHILDMEEWNEEAGFVWLPPTIVHTDVVTVIQPHTLPRADGKGTSLSTMVAVYTAEGERIALWVLGDIHSFNYWGRS